MNYSIAIDGPAGAGKSTIAKLIAKKMDCIYVDTGAMYRAMAVYFLRQGFDASWEDKITAACEDINVEIQYVDGEQQVILNGENITGMLRTEEVGKMASASSVYPAVRLKLVELQRKLAKENRVVMDGRDIGTYVLPDAEVKIYLTASVDERANRRYKELKEKGQAVPDYETIKKDIAERDYRDMNRDFAPLKQADDAVLIDCSDMSIEEVVDTISAIATARDKDV
ncbi:MAG: (d)CMP kinase [Lachnospiraceae bacterium]|nr:(d)CMP kinase [Lachnospiraceae bacterium]